MAQAALKQSARLADKRILVTGATTGIGLEIARRMLDEGARVAITGRNPETLAAAKETLAGALVIASDAGNASEQKALAKALQAHFGRIDGAVINAGIAVFGPAEEWTEGDFDRQIGVNMKGPFFLLQALAPVLANPASIILTASVAAHRGFANAAVYSASKAALLAMGRSLQAEWAHRGIRINAISPGPVQTPIFGKLGWSTEAVAEMQASLRNRVPVKRLGVPREIADAAVFLASDESSYMAGSEILIDGGMAAL